MKIGKDTELFIFPGIAPAVPTSAPAGKNRLLGPATPGSDNKSGARLVVSGEAPDSELDSITHLKVTIPDLGSMVRELRAQVPSLISQGAPINQIIGAIAAGGGFSSVSVPRFAIDKTGGAGLLFLTKFRKWPMASGFTIGSGTETTEDTWGKSADLVVAPDGTLVLFVCWDSGSDSILNAYTYRQEDGADAGWTSAGFYGPFASTGDMDAVQSPAISATAFEDDVLIAVVDAARTNSPAGNLRVDIIKWRKGLGFEHLAGPIEVAASGTDANIDGGVALASTGLGLTIGLGLYDPSTFGTTNPRSVVTAVSADGRSWGSSGQKIEGGTVGTLRSVRQVDAGAVVDMEVIDPSTEGGAGPVVVYALTSAGIVYKSTDEGTTWFETSRDLLDDPGSWYSISGFRHSGGNDQLWVCGTKGRIAVSTDSGDIFTMLDQITHTKPPGNYKRKNGRFKMQGGTVDLKKILVATDPSNQGAKVDVWVMSDSTIHLMSQDVEDPTTGGFTDLIQIVPERDDYFDNLPSKARNRKDYLRYTDMDLLDFDWTRIRGEREHTLLVCGIVRDANAQNYSSEDTGSGRFADIFQGPKRCLVLKKAGRTSTAAGENDGRNAVFIDVGSSETSAVAHKANSNDGFLSLALLRGSPRFSAARTAGFVAGRNGAVLQYTRSASGNLGRLVDLGKLSPQVPLTSVWHGGESSNAVAVASPAGHVFVSYDSGSSWVRMSVGEVSLGETGEADTGEATESGSMVWQNGNRDVVAGIGQQIYRGLGAVQYSAFPDLEAAPDGALVMAMQNLAAGRLELLRSQDGGISWARADASRISVVYEGKDDASTGFPFSSEVAYPDLTVGPLGEMICAVGKDEIVSWDGGRTWVDGTDTSQPVPSRGIDEGSNTGQVNGAGDGIDSPSSYNLSRVIAAYGGGRIFSVVRQTIAVGGYKRYLSLASRQLQLSASDGIAYAEAIPVTPGVRHWSGVGDVRLIWIGMPSTSDEWTSEVSSSMPKENLSRIRPSALFEMDDDQQDVEVVFGGPTDQVLEVSGAALFGTNFEYAKLRVYMLPGLTSYIEFTLSAVVDQGTVGSHIGPSIRDTGKAWVKDQWAPATRTYYAVIYSGTSPLWVFKILGNTETDLVLEQAAATAFGLSDPDGETYKIIADRMASALRDGNKSGVESGELFGTTDAFTSKVGVFIPAQPAHGGNYKLGTAIIGPKVRADVTTATGSKPRVRFSRGFVWTLSMQVARVQSASGAVLSSRLGRPRSAWRLTYQDVEYWDRDTVLGPILTGPERVGQDGFVIILDGSRPTETAELVTMATQAPQVVSGAGELSTYTLDLVEVV